MEKVIENFLKYAAFHTTSDEDSASCPSTERQLALANELIRQCKEIGLEDVSLDDHGYVMATLPSNMDKEIPVIGFIAHMDTSPDLSGEHVKPQFFENYDGKDIVLHAEKNVILSPKEFPDLLDYIGKTLLTTDGTTLLGADDKAGIAEIMAAMEYLTSHPEIKHGKIRIGFTPDEEIGRGADRFDVQKFGAAFAYTMDGGKIGELEYENFNAAQAKIIIHGKNVHPGTAKNKMKNAILIGTELSAIFPPNETPGHTEGYEGFYHLNDFCGNVEEAKMTYIIRDFDMKKFEARKKFVQDAVAAINEKYGDLTVELQLKDQYFNMIEKIESQKHIVDMAFEAMKAVGVEPAIQPIRGGTDGARLSFMGLPCPNIFTGGHNFHGRYEYIPTFAMEKAVEVILKVIEIHTQNNH